MIAFLLAAGLVFHPIAIDVLARQVPGRWTGPMATHVEVEGYVTYVTREADGDWHVRLCDAPDVATMDATRCVVAEIVPSIPQPHPRKGQHVKVRGITRWDGESPGHHWNEVHPVISWEAMP